MGAMQLYRASDALIAHREAIEAHLFGRAMDLFDLTPADGDALRSDEHLL